MLMMMTFTEDVSFVIFPPIWSNTQEELGENVHVPTFSQRCLTTSRHCASTWSRASGLGKASLEAKLGAVLNAHAACLNVSWLQAGVPCVACLDARLVLYMFTVTWL